MTPTVVIVGRPNVGKSTLFNRIVGRRLALVADSPGLTRDRREAEGEFGERKFTLVDTAGLADAGLSDLSDRMQAQTGIAVKRADVIVMMIDGRAGITPDDRHFAKVLRRAGRPIILAVNKCESSAGDHGYFDAFRLGLGEPMAISAEHGIGMGTLFDALAAHLPTTAEGFFTGADQNYCEGAGGNGENVADRRETKLVIVGRPNVGKSTLINRLVGEDRMITGPEPGLTRDAIPVTSRFGTASLRLVDTAGLRRRSQVVESLERAAATAAVSAVRAADIVILVINGSETVDRQDLVIARLAAREGRGLVVAANKWDMVTAEPGRFPELRARLATALPQVRGVPVVTLSALGGEGVENLLPACFAAAEFWNKRLPTAALNRWLAEAVSAHPPPLTEGRRPKLRYLTQVSVRPPTFALFASQAPSQSYRKYLVNRLRDRFGLPGVPIRLLFRQGKNPYAA